MFRHLPKVTEDSLTVVSEKELSHLFGVWNGGLAWLLLPGFWLPCVL